MMVLLVAIIIIDLAADLTRIEFRGVHVDVGPPGAYQGNNLRELSRCQECSSNDAVLRSDHHLGCREGPSDSPGAEGVEGVGIYAAWRRCARRRVGRGVTQPEDDPP
jgi:hypothetical protein